MIDPNHPMRERIGFRSTRGDGAFRKDRWTEVAVYYDPDAPNGHVFTAETKGCSARAGEKERRTALSSQSLERALQHFDDGRGLSTPARIAADQARAWMETHEAMQGAGSQEPFTVAIDNGGGLAIEIVRAPEPTVPGMIRLQLKSDGGVVARRKLLLLAAQIVEAARG